MELQLTLCNTGHQACAPRYGYGPAVREQYVLHLILAGKGWYRRGDQVYSLEANTVFLIHPGELTYYEADANDPWEYCWIDFEGAHVPGLLELCGLSDTPVKTVSSRQAAQTLLAITRVQMEHKGSEVLCTGLMYQFFSQLIDQPEQFRPTAAKAYWASAAEYIRKNYMYDITVAGAAAFVGVERSYLYRLFRSYQGQSPQEYLLQCRVEGARRLLLETPHSITDIAYSCGFRNVATFGRAFRSQTGVTPSAFRKQTV